MADTEPTQRKVSQAEHAADEQKPKRPRAPKSASKNGANATPRNAPRTTQGTGSAWKTTGGTNGTSGTKRKTAPRTKKLESSEPMSNDEHGMDPATPTPPAAPSGPRMVMCAKLGRELPGLDRPPMPGELGQRIYNEISREAWEMWQEHSRLLINHYGLNLADPDARQIMRQQMEEFFFGKDARMPEGWVPESAGAKGKGAVASRK